MFKIPYATFYVDNNYKVYVSGNNENGKLGINHNSNIITPIENTYFSESNIKITKISLENELVLFLDNSNNVYRTGTASGYDIQK